MEKEFIPYQQALDLKELGFDEPCFGRYIYDGRGKEWFLVQTKQIKSASVIFEGDISVDGISVAAPTFSQAFRWFREKYNLNSFIIDSISYNWYFNINNISKDDVVSEVLYFKTYEEAELECLKKLIEIVNG